MVKLIQIKGLRTLDELTLKEPDFVRSLKKNRLKRTPSTRHRDTIVQSFDELFSGHKWHFCVLLRRVNIFSSQIRGFCLLYHGSELIEEINDLTAIVQRNRGQYRSWESETGEKLCFDGE